MYSVLGVEVLLEHGLAGVAGDDAVEVECDPEFVRVGVDAGFAFVVGDDASCRDSLSCEFAYVVTVG